MSMETIAANLELLNTTKVNIKTSIEKKGISVGDTLFEDYPSKIDEIGTYTGHADVEGLKAIGWNDEDIAFFQKHCVNWNLEDDDQHKVPENNTALYGVINATNVKNYKGILVYLPKFNTDNNTNYQSMFDDCTNLVGIPMSMFKYIGTNNFYAMFRSCHSLVAIPPIYSSNCTSFNYMFNECTSLKFIGGSLFSNYAAGYNNTFYGCVSLTEIPPINANYGTDFTNMFIGCHSLTSLKFDVKPGISFSQACKNCHLLKTIELGNVYGCDFTNTFMYCNSLQHISLNSLNLSLDLSDCTLIIDKDSLLNIIKTAKASYPTVATISLLTFNYDIHSKDPDIQAALSKNSYVRLSSRT